MDLKIPGLTDAMTKLDHTATQMDALVNRMDKIVTLLEEQNKLLRRM